MRTLLTGDHLPQTVTPDQFDIGSRVHEYGGGAYWVAEEAPPLSSTSRISASTDVDYRGSTGYGRAYRDALRQLWGIADPADCTAVATWLVEIGEADPGTVISGASAGGYTALRALALSEVFAAASCVSGIIDLLEFRRRTHKFQRHELDRLIGQLPDSLAT